MTSSENAVNRILADLSKIPSQINSFKNLGSDLIEEQVKKIMDGQSDQLKQRGIL